MRWLLVEAAWRLLRTKSVEAAALRAWAHRVAGRRGKKIAVVALARPREREQKAEQHLEQCAGPGQQSTTPSSHRA